MAPFDNLPTQPSILDFKPDKETDLQKQRRECIDAGGKWDGSQCIFPPKETGTNTPKESVETDRGTFLGLNKTDIDILRQQKLKEQQRAGTTIPTPQTPQGQVNPLGTAAALAQPPEGLPALQESGILEQATPEFEEIGLTATGTKGVLDPSDIPLIGEAASVLNSVFAQGARKGLFGKNLKEQADSQAAQIFGDEALFNEAKKEVNKKVLAEGVSAAETFGAVVEAIPIVGGLASKYADKISTPSRTVRDLRTNINSLREAAEFQATQARTGNVPPEVAIGTILEMQGKVDELEAKIRILTQVSAQLRANPEEINLIETEIFRTKQKLFIAAQSAGAALVTEPNPNSVFLTLNELKDKE